MAKAEELASPAEGGCLCGAIRYRVTGAPEKVLVCHCPDCRRAAGAQSVAWLILVVDDFEWCAGEPATHASSPGVRRTFCGTCGTTLGWERSDRPDRVDITIGSLDDPERFPPTKAVYKKHKLSWASKI